MESSSTAYHRIRNESFSVYEANQCNKIIGLPGITGVKLYMIAVSVVDRVGGGMDMRLGGDRLIHCTWDVEFF